MCVADAEVCNYANVYILELFVLIVCKQYEYVKPYYHKTTNMKQKFNVLLLLSLLMFSSSVLYSCKKQAQSEANTTQAEQKEEGVQRDSTQRETAMFRNMFEVHSNGLTPELGSMAPDCTFANYQMEDMKLSEFRGQRVILNIFPSLDTSVCSRSVKRFNDEASKLQKTYVLCISKDLPQAMRRFCIAEEASTIIPLSVFRNTCFEEEYGLLMVDGPMEGLLMRAVFVIDEYGKIIYKEVVPELSDEPNYDAAIAAVKSH